MTLLEILMKNLATMSSQMSHGTFSGDRIRNSQNKIVQHPSSIDIDGITSKGGSPSSDQKDFDQKVLDQAEV